MAQSQGEASKAATAATSDGGEKKAAEKMEVDQEVFS